VSRITLRIGTRGSDLALVQARHVIAALQQAHPGLKAEIVVIRTTGDRIGDAEALRDAGKGVFVKEIERALLARRLDAAVHSLKDMPGELPEGLALGAILEREEAADAFVGRGMIPIEKLPPGSVIGTASLRRQALVQAAYPHVRLEDLRGNLDTRLEKLRHPKSHLAGIVVAAAGLRRLRGPTGVPHQLLPKDRVVPAAGQGALCVEIRANDARMKELLAPLHHERTAAEVAAERELLRRLEGGCRVPLGVHAEAGDDGLLRLTAALARPDGSDLVRGEATGMVESPEEAAEALETILRSRGAEEVLGSLQPRRVTSRSNGHRNGKPRRAKPRRSKARR
jgi:hydroxymethylbilane synthase